MISLIFAMDVNGGIGNNNALPWEHHGQDMQWFRDHTLGKTIVMGRKTFDSLGMPKGLPKRKNIVLTHSTIEAEGENVCSYDNYEEVISQFRNSNDELMVIGGKQIYEAFLPHADRIYMTIISGSYVCDTYFHFDQSQWQTVYTNEFFGSKFDPAARFIILDRVGGKHAR